MNSSISGVTTRSRAIRLSGAAGLIATSLILAACGSTVPLGAAVPGTTTTGGGGVPGVVPGGGGALDSPAGAAGAPTGSVAGAGAASGAVPGTATGGAGTAVGTGRRGGGSTAPGGVAPGAPAPDGAVGPGVTADKIYLGIPYANDTGSANAALGASGVDPGDMRAYYDAVIDDVNKRGGVAGRKLAPVYFEFRATSSQSIESQAQAACEHWTKDNKVFAMFARFTVTQQCGLNAGVLVPVAGSMIGPGYEKFTNVVDPASVALERLAQVTVDAAQRQGYFAQSTEWPSGKVGVIAWDDASYRYAVDKGLTPALSRLGITATDTRYVPIPQNVGALSDSSAAVSNAVLRFQAQGIDHVLIADGSAGVFVGGGLTFLFLNNAQSQNYFPRYAFNTNNAPGASYLPARQQHGMVSVEHADATPENDEGIAKNPERERCFALMKANGIALGDRTKQISAAAACSQVWFTAELIRRASAPNLAAVMQAADRLGGSFRSPLTYGTYLGPGRHDGVALFRLSKFDDSCDCMRYTSAPFKP